MHFNRYITQRYIPLFFFDRYNWSYKSYNWYKFSKTLDFNIFTINLLAILAYKMIFVTYQVCRLIIWLGLAPVQLGG